MFVDKDFNQKHIINLIIIIFGVSLFHYGTKNILTETTIQYVEQTYPNKIVIPPTIIE